MDKTIKKDIIYFYIIEFACIIGAVICSLLPIFADSKQYSLGQSIGFYIFMLGLLVTNYLLMEKWFVGYNAVLPSRNLWDNFLHVWNKIEKNVDEGFFTEEESKNCKERLKKLLDYICDYERISHFLKVFDFTAIFMTGNRPHIKLTFDKTARFKRTTDWDEE